jgi:hypothetical protein
MTIADTSGRLAISATIERNFAKVSAAYGSRNPRLEANSGRRRLVIARVEIRGLPFGSHLRAACAERQLLRAPAAGPPAAGVLAGEGAPETAGCPSAAISYRFRIAMMDVAPRESPPCPINMLIS